MTGYYVRIERDDGSFADVQINEMTNTELQRFANVERDRKIDGWPWVIALAKWIRDNVKQEVRP